jgi:hypothetical protein
VITDLGSATDRLIVSLWACNVTYGESVKEFKRRFIRYVLEANGGNHNSLSRTIAELEIDFEHAKRGYQKPVTGVGASRRMGASA